MTVPKSTQITKSDKYKAENTNPFYSKTYCAYLTRICRVCFAYFSPLPHFSEAEAVARQVDESDEDAWVLFEVVL